MTSSVTPADVACLVQSAPTGLKAAQIGERLGIHKNKALQLARYAQAAGLIDSVTIDGSRGIWMARDLADKVRAERREHRRVYSLALYHKRREAQVIDSYNRIIDPPDWPITRRIVRAGDAPPPETTAPRSVFELGGLA